MSLEKARMESFGAASFVASSFVVAPFDTNNALEDPLLDAMFPSTDDADTRVPRRVMGRLYSFTSRHIVGAQRSDLCVKVDGVKDSTPQRTAKKKSRRKEMRAAIIMFVAATAFCVESVAYPYP